MTNADCISTISGQELQASGGHAGAVIIFNQRERAANGVAASLPGFRRATRNAQPKRRYLIFSLVAVLAFVSIHPWKKSESVSKSEMKRSADYTDYAD
jgi:hypothetical protein